jgi:hypothetical protein
MNLPKSLTPEQVRDARCSFCGKSKSEVRKLVVAGAHAPEIAICDECFIYVAEIMTGETPVLVG